MGKGEAVNEVTDEKGSHIYRASKLTVRTWGFFPLIYIWGVTGVSFLTLSIMNYNTLEKNT